MSLQIPKSPHTFGSPITTSPESSLYLLLPPPRIGYFNELTDLSYPFRFMEDFQQPLSKWGIPSPQPSPQLPSPIKANKVIKPTKPSSKNSSNFRSRHGCVRCRKRRVKCDETKPHCGACESRGVSCSYTVTLQFREDFENQGKKFGREGVWSKTSTSKTKNKTLLQLTERSEKSYYLDIRNKAQLIFINFFYEDLNRRLKILYPCLRPSIIPPDINKVYDHTSLNYALNYYIDFISPIFNPISTKEDSSIVLYLEKNDIVIEKGLDLLSLIKYSQTHTHIFYLILSLGSMYLSKFNGALIGSEWLSKSRSFQKSGASLLNGLMNGDNPQCSTDVLLSLVLMIMYEIGDDCNSEWRNHLRKCKSFVHSPNFVKPKDNLELSLLKFCLEYLNYTENMGRTACKDQNSFFLAADEDSTLSNSVGESRSLISWMGCDRRLVNAISDITDLSLERRNPGITEQKYQILIRKIENQLLLMNLHIKSEEILFDIGTDIENFYGETDVSNSDLILINDSIDSEKLCFLLSSEVKRMAAVIYLECCLMNKSPEDEDIGKMVTWIYKNLKFIILKHDFKWVSTLIWSIFIASVEISVLSEDREELRYLTLQMLDKIEKYSLGNVNQTREIILKTWKARDLSASDENSFGTITKQKKRLMKRKPQDYGKYLGIVNDWETFVADESYTISLG